jgi:hypothetical protein
VPDMISDPRPSMFPPSPWMRHYWCSSDRPGELPPSVPCVAQSTGERWSSIRN